MRRSYYEVCVADRKSVFFDVLVVNICLHILL